MRTELPNLSRSSWILGLILLLCAAGLVNLYSISQLDGLGAFKKQLIWVLAGLVTMTIISRLKPLKLERHSLTFYLLFLGLLALIFVFGKTVSGSRSWFQIGPVSVQPSEFIKIGIIMVLANYYANQVAAKENYGLTDLAKPIAFLFLPTAAVIAQPDMGTAITILLTGSSIILLLGISRRALLRIIIIALVSVVPLWHLLVEDYQKERIYSFLDTSSDPFGISYNSIQSQIAIGSGMGFGKGFSLGSQSNLNFLPAHHTDFAFSVIAEEWGFRGSVFILLLYFSIILFILNIATSSEDRFATIACLGVAAMLFWHAVINIAMVTGLMPIIGTPLFFISYGGSSTLTAFIGIGIVLCLRKK
ncbi:MAG: rod shape-determining protein RodA [Candidatus Dadabacteria bacterium]|nr:rod shape-determining protein RodA [Candidatus Dadabacteria bacterium]MYK49483.1 rod shape-determining protein RodA [Candidatus Dadabacteria bacterium]